MKDKMLRVMITQEQFEILSRLTAAYQQPNISECVRMMMHYFDRHRPAVIVQPKQVKEEPSL